MLARFLVALRFLRAFDGFVEHGHELRASAEAIHGTALDQRFQHALVEKPEINLVAELEYRAEFPELLASLENGVDGSAANVLYRGKAEADGFAVGREVCVADVDVRRLDGNAHLAALVDVLDDLVGAAGFSGEHGRHELDGIVRLEICGVVREQRIGGRVRFVEAVLGELRHQVEDLFDLALVEAALDRALYKALALLRHLLDVLLTHRATEKVGFAERVSGETLRYLHHLLLINDDAKRFAQDLFQLRQLVFDFLVAVLARDEVVNHAALNRTGAVERVQGGEIFDRVRLVAAQHVAHAVRFKLEDSGSQCLVENLLVRSCVIERYGV